jgi:hypothetical protein
VGPARNKLVAPFRKERDDDHDSAGCSSQFAWIYRSDVIGGDEMGLRYRQLVYSFTA